MKAICLWEKRLSPVCVDTPFCLSGASIEALTFSDNIAVLSHSVDFITQANTRDVHGCAIECVFARVCLCVYVLIC